MEKIWYRRSEWIWVLAATFRKDATNVNSNRIRSLQKWIWWVFRSPRAVMPRSKPSYEYQSQRTGCSGQDSGLWSRRLFQRFKIKFQLSFVVIFSLPVVQFALRFFYFKQKYSLSLRIHTWAHGNASVSESLSFTENVPYVEAHAQINCVRRCGNRSNRWFP